MIPAIEEAILGLRVGGVRRVIVPEELGYPTSGFDAVGPKPSSFSGRRTLDHLLKKQGIVDKTLMFDLELLAVT